MKQYTITLRFKSDRPLTASEQYKLLADIETQVREPVDESGEEIDVSVEDVESHIQWS